MLYSIRVIGPVIAAVISCGVARANVIVSTTGSFTHDDDQVSFNFSLLMPETVTMRTWSFGGGTNANGQLIAPGGFAPVLSLFNAAAPQSLLATDLGGTAPSNCGARNIDPVTGFCLDAYLNESLAAGSYFLYLTEFDNTPNGPTLANGCLEQGKGNFTGGPFFLNAGAGFQRTGDWAVDITTPTGTTVPEPSSAALAISVLSILTLLFSSRKRGV
jgi:hypothetical protein